MNNRRTGVSIVIATADRPRMVLDCVASFREQVPSDVEVLVVDAGASAPVPEESLRGLWAESRVVNMSQQNAGGQRNEGVRQARGEIIVFLDDDCLVQPGWWPAIVAPLLRDEDEGLRSAAMPIPPARGGLAHPPAAGSPEDGRSAHGPRTQEPRTANHEPGDPVGAVAGAVWCNPRPTLTDARGGYVNWRGEPVQVTHRSASAPRDVDWPMTTNMAVLRDVLVTVGGFCEEYGLYDEDVDLGLKIRRAGWGIRFIPEAAVYHYYRTRPRRPPTKRSEFMLGRNRSLLLVRHFGLSARLVFFMLTGPWVVAWRAVRDVARTAYTAAGHGVSYVVGMWVGIVVGLRNGEKGDRAKFQGRGGQGRENADG